MAFPAPWPRGRAMYTKTIREADLTDSRDGSRLCPAVRSLILQSAFCTLPFRSPVFPAFPAFFTYSSHPPCSRSLRRRSPVAPLQPLDPLSLEPSNCAGPQTRPVSKKTHSISSKHSLLFGSIPWFSFVTHCNAQLRPPQAPEIRRNCGSFGLPGSKKYPRPFVGSPPRLKHTQST
jgi:hypothetical protein